MKSRLSLASLSALIILLSACTHSLHLSHFSDFGPSYAAFQKGTWIKAEEEQFVIMGFITQTDYVNLAHKKLMDQCQDGTIQSIQTEYYTDHGFFSWTNRVRMQGLCLRKS
jgi:hypothetical protein